ncbi:MAG: biotin transporter BioY [Candidatus Kapabacteria bacterium]|nr:biotin transporter BioY [Candidatus Kapabacteria bacterium]
MSIALPYQQSLRLRTVMTVVGTAIAMAVAANISMRLPNTPVPVTGQTVVVIAAAILLGRARSTAAVTAYLTAGALGAPVFANGMSTMAFAGPTAGYLLSFLPVAWLVGTLARQSWAKSVPGTVGLAVLGHAVILALGSTTLALFVGASSMWTMGIAPFMLGSLVKSLIVGLLACSFRSTLTGDCSYGSR